jgi:hypothetical protein
LTTAITALTSTQTKITTCIQIQNGDTFGEGSPPGHPDRV